MKKKQSLGIVLLSIMSLLSCKKEKPTFFAGNELEINEQSLKRNKLLTETDDKINIENLVKTKSFYKKEDSYILDYKYPFLDESHRESFKVFNDFIHNEYINRENSVKNTLENENLFCDVNRDNVERYKRMIDYKIYTNKNNLLSVLLYKANHYKDETHYSYMFKALNFNMEKGEFLSFDTFFKPETEHIVLDRLNEILSQKTQTESYYKECWKLTKDTFDIYKDNFVINDRQIKFYFDDCVICPTYAGRYSIKIPLSDISDILRENL